MGFSLFGKNKQSASDANTDELEVKATPRRRKKNAEQPVDPVLPEKKRARRRLVGAAAMVLAAIIGLPLLLESEPQPLADDIQIHIPSIEKPVADARLASSDPAATEPQPASASGEPEASAPQLAGEPEKSSPPVVAAPAPAPEVKAAADSKAGSRNTDKAASAAPASKPETAKPKQSGGSTESERAAQVRALLEGKSTQAASTAPAAAAAKSGKFVLQVAALGSAEKAKELQDKLGKAGIKSYTEKVKVSGSEQIRVRIGPFASREEADRMRSRLSGLGLDGMVMSL